MQSQLWTQESITGGQKLNQLLEYSLTVSWYMSLRGQLELKKKNLREDCSSLGLFYGRGLAKVQNWAKSSALDSLLCLEGR